MLGQLRKRQKGAPLSQAELEQRRAAARSSAAKRRRNINDYEREVRSIPILDEAEERNLISRWKNQGDLQARDKIIRSHLRLSVSSARQLAGYGLPIEDLVAAGNVGLLQAAENFDPSKGVRFSTFALPYIRGAQFEYIQSNWSIVRQGTNKDQKRLFFSLRRDLDHANGVLSEEKAREIAARRGVKVASVKDMAARFSSRDPSLNIRTGEDDDGDEWIDRLSSGEHAEDKYIAAETERHRRVAVARAISELNERERRVLAARWLRQRPATLHEVGRELGISAERVRQIENKALQRIRAKVAQDPLLAKRTPGAPLSDAELRQRREAARARWAASGGALAGALAAGYAVPRIAELAARKRVSADPDQGKRALRLAERRRDWRMARIEQTVAERLKHNRKPFTRTVAADEARFGPLKPGKTRSKPLGRPDPVTRRVRDLRAFLATADRKIAQLDDLRRKIDESFRLGTEPPKTNMSEYQIARLRQEIAQKVEPAKAELEELMRARPARKVRRLGTMVREHTRSAVSGKKGKIRRGSQVKAHIRHAHQVRVRGDLSSSRMRELRGALFARTRQQAEAAQARVAARWQTAAPKLREAFVNRAVQSVANKLKGKWRVPALLAGAAVGAAAGYGLRKRWLAKAATWRTLRAAMRAAGHRPSQPGFKSALESMAATMRPDWAARQYGSLRPGLTWDANVKRAAGQALDAREAAAADNLRTFAEQNARPFRALFRGIPYHAVPKNKVPTTPGAIYETKHVLSATRRPSTVSQFINARPDEQVLIFRNTRGARLRGAIKQDKSLHGHEDEVLLPPGKWRVDRVEMGPAPPVRTRKRTYRTDPSSPVQRIYLSPLFKAAPDEPVETPTSTGDEAELASKLAAMFRSWLENPARVGNRDDIAEALGPLYNILASSSEEVVPPPTPEDSLYGTSDGRAMAFSFDVRSPEVERRLREYALDRIRAISEESRNAIRAVLIEAAQQGLPVEEQARRIREAIGLSPGQYNWVTSYRRGLEVLDPRVLNRALRDQRHDGPIRRAIETNTPLSAEDIDRYVASYHRRVLAYRAMTIARTEALRGANTATVETAKVILQENPELTVEKTWIATKDERTRDDHRELDGKVVLGLETPFEVNGDQIRWPHDPMAPARQTVNCRCTLGLRLIPKPGYGRLIAEAV